MFCYFCKKQTPTMKSKLLLFVAAVLLLESCKTGSNFTSRRYMAGHYKANHASVQKPEAQKTAHAGKKATGTHEA